MMKNENKLIIAIRLILQICRTIVLNARIFYCSCYIRVIVYIIHNNISHCIVFTLFTTCIKHLTRLVIGTSKNSRFCKEFREDNFLFWWRRVHEDASQGMYMSKIEICFFTTRILQNQRMLCGGECFRD